MWIKICANTNLEDAQLAAKLGADAVGFVFAPSKRQVTAAQVAAITPHLPDSLERVGVFGSIAPSTIAQTVKDAGLNAVQLHGAFDEGLLHRLAVQMSGKIGTVQIIQVMEWSVQTGAHGEESPAQVAERLSKQLQRMAAIGVTNRVLVDSRAGPVSGGTGIPFDWHAAADLFKSAPAGIRLVAAGGLNPGNIRDAISMLNPWGVDVASGVEAEPGRKDPQKLADFIRNARATGS